MTVVHELLAGTRDLNADATPVLRIRTVTGAVNSLAGPA